MTPAELQAAMPYSGSRANTYASHLTAAMLEFSIDTPQRQAAFLAQIAHESGSLRYTLEIASGALYEGRKDLGNVMPGDGPRFRGRGLMQITGRAMYEAFGKFIGMNLIENPAYVETPSGACRSAGWYWWFRGLNSYADKDAFGALTRAINGGYNGLDDRIRAWLVARKALRVQP